MINKMKFISFGKKRKCKNKLKLLEFESKHYSNTPTNREKSKFGRKLPKRNTLSFEAPEEKANGYIKK